MQNKNAAKKRLMFIQKEDYNFLAYNTIILLNALDCTTEAKRFKDFRKIAYLIDLINEGGDPNKLDQRFLSKIYTRAQIKKKLLHHLIIILKNKNYIGVSMNVTSKTIDLWLKKEFIPEDFLRTSLFLNETTNALVLKTALGMIKTVTIKTLVDKIFTQNNVLTWEV
ncbi:hypothetical protein GCM10007415_22900 [Parapedobacter pyrenivorans]|uniref:Uncharacterized protein n=1 Tax=Parapedobacter pyrenivorans TaxID=1305674 RepID=A0A917HSX5_9SPHI|nr:hypothetical protein [Parapedobacter pyrenivorans]GGG88307.1 hypothetical protein GCM10007415_22900 [Parapedobacter pyrenivorans]